jgi:alpha-amylase/alpha-mannosidase (GH57 family)
MTSGCLDKQLEIMRSIIPSYKKLQEEGTIEVAVSPFYHPILPLLCDTDIARVSLPGITLPKTTFRHPEDAKKQIDTAVKFYEERFGRPPRGMWPSEGSVSDQAVELMIESGLKWAATDEEVLFRSLQRQKTPEALYRPYIVEKGREDVAHIQDRGLSDAIGFVYKAGRPKRPPLISYAGCIQYAKNSLIQEGIPVPIILDGENAWSSTITTG